MTSASPKICVRVTSRPRKARLRNSGSGLTVTPVRHLLIESDDEGLPVGRKEFDRAEIVFPLFVLNELF